MEKNLGGGGAKPLWEVGGGGLMNILGGAHPPAPPRKSVPGMYDVYIARLIIGGPIQCVVS